MNHPKTINPLPLTSDFWVGILASAISNSMALTWAAIWLIVGFLSAGMSSMPGDELNQLILNFIILASCCPAGVNLLLLIVGIARRKPPFLSGCLVGLLGNLLLAGCMIGILAINLVMSH